MAVFTLFLFLFFLFYMYCLKNEKLILQYETLDSNY